MNAIERLSAGLDKISVFFGKVSSWLVAILVLLISTDVFLRYTFNTTSSWIVELEWHLFALIFLLGFAYALQKDQHVRVDVFYTNFSERNKAIVNLAGTLILLIPWCFILLRTSLSYAENSFVIGEGSAEPDGLPARYIIKYAMSLGIFLLLLQGVSEALKAGIALVKPQNS